MGKNMLFGIPEGRGQCVALFKFQKRRRSKVYDDALLEKWGRKLATRPDQQDPVRRVMLMRAVEWCLATGKLGEDFWRLRIEDAVGYLCGHSDTRIAALAGAAANGQPFVSVLEFEGPYPPNLPPQLQREHNWRGWRMRHAAAVRAAIVCGVAPWEAAADIRISTRYGQERLRVVFYLPGRPGSTMRVLMTEYTVPVFCAVAAEQGCAELPELVASYEFVRSAA